MPYSGEQFYKEIDFMHRKWPDVKNIWFIFKISPIPMKIGSDSRAV